MIAGSLQFTLGLQANQFLNALGVSSSKLVGFTAVANALSNVMAKMWASIQQGGNLTDLAAGAGISVKALYQLQEAFKQVGASADRVPAIMLRLQRTLGTSEGRSALASLGLDPKQLAAADPAAQMERIGQAMARMNSNAAGAAAFKLFGREGATTMRQIAASGTDFSDAIRRASADANVWQKVAFEFDAIADKVTEIEGRMKTMWALFTGAAIQAFRTGQLSELITDIIVTGFKGALDILPGIIQQLGVILEGLFPRVFEPLRGAFEDIADAAFDQYKNNPGRAREIEAARTLLNQKLAARGRSLVGESGAVPRSSAPDLLAQGMAAAGGRFSGLNERMLALIAGLTQGSGTIGGAGAATFGGGLKLQSPNVTSIEKLGFIFNGKSSATDYARATADNTRKTVGLLTSIDRKLEANSYANQ